MPSSDTSSDSEGNTRTPKPFEGHTDDVWDVAYSPDGAWIASASNDGTIRIWDSKTGLSVGQPLIGHKDGIYVIAFSPQGDRIVSGSDDKTLRVWDISTQEVVLGPLDGHTDVVNSVQYSPDGQLICSASSDRFVRLWNAQSGECTTTLEHPNKLTLASFSPCGAHVATACDDNMVRVWVVATRILLHPPLAAHKSEVWSVAYSPDGRFLASGSRDCTICLWDTDTGKLCRRPMKGHRLAVSSLAFTNHGQALISASYDRSLRAWDPVTGDCLWGPMFSDGRVNGISVSPTKHVVACGRGYSMCIRDAMSGKLVLPEGHEPKRYKGNLMLTIGSVNSLAWFPCETRFATAGFNDTIRVWDAKKNKDSIEVFSDQTIGTTSIDISFDGSMLVSSSEDHTICLWNLKTKKLVVDPIKGHTDRVNAVSFTPDSSRLVSASKDGTICLWGVKSGRLFQSIDAHDNYTNALNVSPGGSKLAWGSGYSTVYVWDLETRTVIAGPFKHDDGVLSVCWSLDEAFVLSGSRDKSARVWRISNGEQLLKVEHDDRVNCVQYSPDGITFLSASADKTVRIWGTGTGQQLWSLEHESAVRIAAFSPDGTRIASGTYEGYIRVWDSVSGKLVLGKGSEGDGEENETVEEGPGGRDAQRERTGRTSEESFMNWPATVRREGPQAIQSSSRPAGQGPRLASRFKKLFDLTDNQREQARNERTGGNYSRSASSFPLRRIVPVSVARAKERLAGAPERRRRHIGGEDIESGREDEGDANTNSDPEREQAGPSHVTPSGEAYHPVDGQSTDRVNMCSCLPW